MKKGFFFQNRGLLKNIEESQCPWNQHQYITICCVVCLGINRVLRYGLEVSLVGFLVIRQDGIAKVKDELVRRV